MRDVTPSISVVGTGDGYRIEQSRPPAGAILARMAPDEALAHISHLLPICGEAQRIAGARAMAAARGTPASAPPADEVDELLLREQIQSSIWRLTVDWPALLGEERDLETLRRAMLAHATEEKQSLLSGLLAGLDSVDSAEALRRWTERTDGAAPRVLRRARATGEVPEARNDRMRNPDALQADFQEPRFWPAMDRPLEPPGAEVGALAMARHPGTEALRSQVGPLAARLLAQALDALFLVTASPSDAALPYPATGVGMSTDDGHRAGIGWAMTARGPLVHRVVLDEASAERVLRWDVLAPTDWHFAPRGPAATALAETALDEASVRWLVAGFDPCAAWSVSSLAAAR